MEAEFQGSKTLQPFSPRWTDPELLERTLVGRKDLVDRLEQLVLEGAGGPNKYQRLIIGPRGSGKTHILKVLHTRLWRNAELKDRLLIIYLLEDELGVASFLDFLVRLLKAIVAWYPENTGLAADLEHLYDLPSRAQQHRAVELLLQAAEQRDLLIIMENLGITFDNVHGFGRKGQQAFRDLVQQHPRFMVFASAQALLDGVSTPNAPFYEFFSITHLKKLTPEEAMEMLAAVAAAYGNAGVSEFLRTPEGRSRVRAIYEFTGGNHRLLVTFFDFLAAESVSQISDAFLDALKPLKPYYQEQMRGLSAQQQKIVQYLSLKRTPQTVKDIARGCLATSNTVSSQMQILMQKGFVERIQEGRESYYEISETLFRICYEADLDYQGAPIRLFVDFLGTFYTAQELEARARGFHLLAQTMRETAHETEAGLYQMALQQYHQRQLDYGASASGASDEWKKFFRELSERQAYEEIISFAGRLGPSRDTDIVIVEADAYAGQGNLAGACELLRKEVGSNPQNPSLYAKLASLLDKKGDLADAEACCRQALSLEGSNETARRTLAAVLSKTGRDAEAAAEFRALLSDRTLVSASDFLYLGRLENRGGNPKDALAEFKAYISIDSTNAEAHAGAAAALYQLDDFDEAEKESKIALVADSENQDALMILGLLMNQSSRFQESLPYLQKLNEIRIHDPHVLSLLGLAYRELGLASKAEDALREAVEAEANEYTIASLTRLLFSMDRYSEMEPLLRDAVQKWPANAHLRRYLGQLLMNTDRPAECLEQIKIAQRLEPQKAHYFLMGGLAALGSKNLVVSEMELREAIRLDPKLAMAWRYLGEVLSETERGNEAITALETATTLAPEDPESWVVLGNLQRARGDVEKAEAAFRRAMELNSTDAAHLLADLLFQDGRLKEAEALLLGMVEKDPADIKARLDLSNVLVAADRAAKALEQVLNVQKLAPNNAAAYLCGGLAGMMLGNSELAEVQLRRALELNPALVDAKVYLAKVLEQSGRYAEAIELLSGDGDGLGQAKLLAARADLKATMNDLPGAVADYESSLRIRGDAAGTLLKLSTVLLMQGRVDEAALKTNRAVEVAEIDELTDGLQRNLNAMFTSCTRSQMPTYLEPVLQTLVRERKQPAFERALSLSVFDLLRRAEGTSEDRLRDAVWSLENIVARQVNVTILVQFLQVGIGYFKQGDRKALMNLSREERAVFLKELGIEEST